MNFSIPGIEALTAQIKRLADLYERDMQRRAPLSPEPSDEDFSVTNTDHLHEYMMETNEVYRRKHEEGADELEAMMPEKPDADVR